MGINWSEDQLKVINLRDRDILVSAAAGSGKTTVLVERIIRRITDEKNPIDIDQLLVVTFTKAAAAEMKERIAAALEAELEQHPDDINLQKQCALVQHAMITTIDGFCLFVVRNYFEEINLDPTFRVADTVEIELLIKDMIDVLFEAEYQKQENKQFFDLINTYSGAKNDQKVRDMVEKIYKTSLSSPWPKQWIEGLLNDQSGVMALDKIADLTKANLESALMEAKRIHQMSLNGIGPDTYIPAFESDIQSISDALKCEGYWALYEYLQSFSFVDLSKKKPSNSFSDEEKTAVKNARDKYKKSITDLIKKYYVLSKEEVQNQQKRVAPYIKELVRLALLLMDQIEKEKTKRRMIDFSDMEHFALRILVDEETHQPRPVAEVFQKQFKEIMIDEYQDSNEVQEVILKSISGHENGNYNMFMVGDVKQSIYRFRMAKPELFIGKYESYSKDDSEKQRIDLQMNYRSRAGVLEFCNSIFENLMEKELGGVDYDAAASLYPGNKDYPETDEPCAEVLLFDNKSINDDNTKLQREAAVVAHRILELKESMKVTDKKTKELREPAFSDFVILLRSIKTLGPVFQEVLEQNGIPAHVDSTTGYFDAMEVNVVLNLLTLIDNPYQDIPMAVVLKSMIGGYTDEDLAEMRVTYQEEKITFAESAMRYLKENEAPFYQLLLDLRERNDLPVHEVIQMIFARTGYDLYVASLPGGKTRRANLEMLVEKAIDFEKTSYKGVFHFLRYIHQMRKYEKDFGEAEANGEGGDLVHIKTIHASKGLEYPIVFVSGMGSNFNDQDTKQQFILHSDLGAGLMEISGEPRAKKSSLMLEAIKNYTKLETLGEEMRVLYVALTRAKEKLVITGSSIPEKIESGGYFDFARRASAKCFIDWIVPALYAAGKQDLVKEVDRDYFVLQEAQQSAEKMVAYHELCDKIVGADSEQTEQIKTALKFVYPYQSDLHRKSKYSVSEIKHASMKQRYDELEGEVEAASFILHEKDPYIPKFASRLGVELQQAKTQETPAGALFGTAVHRMMEVLDFAALAKVDFSKEEELENFAKQELQRICDSGEMEEELYNRLRGNELITFLKSEIAEPMAKAAARGELYREKPFVMSQEDGTLIQGIIDVFWRDEDGIVLLDYKTDRVDSSEELIIRYKDQLLLYKDALERLFGTVKGTLIYSYRLKEVISI